MGENEGGSMGRMRKGFVFTLDVIIAAAVLSTLMTSMYYMLGSMQPTSPDYRYLVATDSLATLDLSGDLKHSIENSTDSNLKEYLDHAVQPQFCGNITVRNQTDSKILSTTKSGCSKPSGKVTVARRMVMVEGEPYRVKMEVWGN